METVISPYPSIPIPIACPPLKSQVSSSDNSQTGDERWHTFGWKPWQRLADIVAAISVNKAANDEAEEPNNTHTQLFFFTSLIMDVIQYT